MRELYRGRIKDFFASKLSELKPASPNTKRKAEGITQATKEPQTLARNTVRDRLPMGNKSAVHRLDEVAVDQSGSTGWGRRC